AVADQVVAPAVQGAVYIRAVRGDVFGDDGVEDAGGRPGVYIEAAPRAVSGTAPKQAIAGDRRKEQEHLAGSVSDAATEEHGSVVAARGKKEDRCAVVVHSAAGNQHRVATDRGGNDPRGAGITEAAPEDLRAITLESGVDHQQHARFVVVDPAAG